VLQLVFHPAQTATDFISIDLLLSFSIHRHHHRPAIPQRRTTATGGRRWNRRE
jgi:hypothetical protein